MYEIKILKMTYKILFDETNNLRLQCITYTRCKKYDFEKVSMALCSIIEDANVITSHTLRRIRNLI